MIACELQGKKERAAAAFNARVIPSVAYTDLEATWVGLTAATRTEHARTLRVSGWGRCGMTTR